jgi:hypothetical protein
MIAGLAFPGVEHYAEELRVALDPQDLAGRLESANTRDVHLCLVDLWGEADRLVRAAGEDPRGEDARRQLESVCKALYVVENHAQTTPGLLYETRAAEAILFDFLFGDNVFRVDARSAMSWFAQWYKGYNFRTLV